MDPLPAATAVEHLETRAGYDRWAEIYDGEDNPLVALEGPLMRQLLGDVSGQDVLDLGCGTGRHSLWLARAGARVCALDFSPAMLERARDKAEASGIEFLIHDLRQPLPFANESFDRVVCGLVLDHIADLEGLFLETRRVCRRSGSAAFSVMHPAMMLRGVQARFRDPASGREIRPASCPHQLSDYLMAATRAGFQILEVSEHTVDQALAERMERAKKYVGWPILFFMHLAAGND